MLEKKEVAFQALQAPVFTFNPSYKKTDVETALDIIRRTEIVVAPAACQIYEYLNSEREFKLDPDGIENDPVLKANRHLSPALLYSLLKLPETKEWAAIVLSKEFPAEAEKSLKILQEAMDYGDSFSQRVQRMYQAQRNIFILLSADELCRKRKLDLERQFLSPLKIMETKLGYDPYFPNLISRAAGTQIPFSLRAFHGRLRLARQAVAQDSIITALAQNYQFLFMAHGHYLNTIKMEAERTLGIKLGFTERRNEEFCFKLTKGKANKRRLKILVAENPLIQTMLTIAANDYHPQIIKTKLQTLTDFSRMAYNLSILMIDPAITESLVNFPIIETTTFEPLKLPPTKLYHFNQALTALRAKTNYYHYKEKGDF